jgi:NitT/TauT family transport system ATP-binding protein
VGETACIRIEFDGVTRRFVREDGAATVAIQDMSFAVRDREFVSLIGPSGCGKSTTLKLVSGLDMPSAGRVLVDGRPVTGPDPRIGFMLQKDLLLPWLTVLDNVTIGLRMQGVPRAERLARGRALIAKYGLQEFEAAYPRHLSGGMRQRVALMRTLAVDPDILLLDEPLSALDFQTKLKMEEELLRILNEEGKTVILITHDIGEAVSVSDRILVCSARPGRIKAEFALPFSKGHSPADVRRKAEFAEYFNAVWRELESDVRI